MLRLVTTTTYVVGRVPHISATFASLVLSDQLGNISMDRTAFNTVDRYVRRVLIPIRNNLWTFVILLFENGRVIFDQGNPARPRIYVYSKN